MVKKLNIIRCLRKSPQSQHGAVLLVMLVILIMGGTALLLNSLNSTSVRALREKVAMDNILAGNEGFVRAKEGLITYALNSANTGSTSARPGNFPCPDRDEPGNVNYGLEESSCSSSGGTSIGRVPWKTLGISEPLDAEGEPLWYVLSDNFRKSASIVNSDTRGTLQLYNFDGTTLLTPSGSEAVALIFAPGKIVGGQKRDTTADKKSAANYLESAYTYNNATTTGPFVATDKSNSFNDRMVFIKTSDFIPIIERNVANALKDVLAKYKAAKGVYPYPASLSTCKDNTSCVSNTSICRGRIPQIALPFDWSGTYVLPRSTSSSWFMDNQWYRTIYYSVGAGSLATTPAGCSLNLTISGTNTAGLFFMPGTPLNNILRTYPSTDLTLHFEDAENQNSDDIYIYPTANSNDLLITLP